MAYNMRSANSHLKRGMSFGEKEINGVSSASPLHNFVKAKKKINKTFAEISDFLFDATEFICGCDVSEENKPQLKKFAEEMSGFVGQVASIAEMMSRDQMKVAFFGRTSNGKSSVVNAMLQDRILPMGIGHTTNCFMSVHGSDSQDPFILIPGSDERRNVTTLSQIAHALHKEKLPHSSLVKVYWPKTKCKMLSEDVVLVDSPGIDVDPDTDLWIDTHCLDADVFVLVANAESTLMQTEKNFFHKVNQKLSRPNVFILNNRWDASAGEADEEMMELVKKQHLERCVSFLADELKCIDKVQAEDRVFFVSAKEALMSRMQRHRGMPEEGGAIHVDGFHGRKLEFEHFEHKFEECISKSAIQTKFESHAVSGMSIISRVKVILETIAGWGHEHRTGLINSKRECENRLEYIKENLDYYTNDWKKKITTISTKVEQQVADVMAEEIGRLGVVINDFDHPFHPHPGFLHTYKKELNKHIERGLGRNLMSRCSNPQSQIIHESQNLMAEEMKKLLPQSAQENIMVVSPRNDFEVSYRLEIHDLCSDFQEDIDFHFSLGWEALMKKFLAPRNAKLAVAVGKTIEQDVKNMMPNQDAILPGQTSTTHDHVVPRCNDGELTVAVFHGIASSRTTTLVVVVGGLLWRVMGWKVIVCCSGLYTGLYVIERLRWTNGAKEKAFKKQFGAYAAEKLQLVISFTSHNCSLQVQQELSSTFARLQSLVERSKDELEEEILDLDSEIKRLETIEDKARVFRNKGCWFESELEDFLKSFGLAKSKM